MQSQKEKQIEYYKGVILNQGKIAANLEQRLIKGEEMNAHLEDNIHYKFYLDLKAQWEHALDYIWEYEAKLKELGFDSPLAEGGE